MAYTHRDLPDNIRSAFRGYFKDLEEKGRTAFQWNGISRLEFTDDCSNESLPEEERLTMIFNQSVDYYLAHEDLITDQGLYEIIHAWEQKMDGYIQPKVKVLDSEGKVSQEVIDHVEKNKKMYRIREAIIDEVCKKWDIEDFEDSVRNAVHEAMIKYGVVVAPDK